MRLIERLLDLFRSKPHQEPALMKSEISCIVGLACAKRSPSYNHWHPRAIIVYRAALARGVPIRSNIYMDYMAEVDHSCPDLALRSLYRNKIRKLHQDNE